MVKDVNIVEKYWSIVRNKICSCLLQSIINKHKLKYAMKHVLKKDRSIIRSEEKEKDKEGNDRLCIVLYIVYYICIRNHVE